MGKNANFKRGGQVWSSKRSTEIQLIYCLAKVIYLNISLLIFPLKLNYSNFCCIKKEKMVFKATI